MAAKPGYRPPASDTTKGKCCECMCNYADGRRDCEHINCPIYMRHQFRKLIPKFDWVFDSKWARHELKRIQYELTKEEYIEKYIFNSTLNKPILTRSKMYRAKCFDCCNDFTEGRKDCNIRGCPLYYWMPYRTSLPLYNWMFDLSYTNRHANRAFVSNMYRKIKLPNGHMTTKINIHKYITTYLPWIGPPIVRRVRKVAT